MNAPASLRWLIALSALAAVAAVAAAANGVEAASNLPAAQENADNHDGAPPFAAPGPAFDAKKASGETIFLIPAPPQSQLLPSLAAMEGGIRQAAAAVGVKTLSCSNSGSTAEWTACFKEAAARNVNAIVLVGGTEPAALQPYVTVATNGGTDVIAAHVPDPAEFSGSLAAAYSQQEAGLTAIVPAPYAEIGKLLADEVVVDRPNPVGRFVIFSSSDLAPSAGLLLSVQNELAAVCGSACTVDTIDIPYSQWKTAAIPAAEGAVLSKVTTTFIPLFDKMSGLLAEGVHDARAVNPTATQPRIHTYGGTPDVIQMGQDNNRVEGVVAENMNWLGWATMDQVLRVLTGTKPVASEKTGLQFIDDDAWGAEGMGPEGWSFPPLLDQGWGDPRGDEGWITGYRKLWGLPGDSDGYQLSASAGGGGDDD